MFDNVTLMLGCGPARLYRNNVACAERCVGVVDEVVFRVGEELSSRVSYGFETGFVGE